MGFCDRTTSFKEKNILIKVDPLNYLYASYYIFKCLFCLKAYLIIISFGSDHTQTQNEKHIEVINS